jgi:ribonucleoside-diphosphate reductase alpha chain
VGPDAIARAGEQSSTQRPLVPEGPVDAHDSDGPPFARRHRLPDERRSLTHKFNVGGHEGYIVVGVYPDGQPGEIFITMAKEGSTVSGLMDSFATAISVALQHGVPLKLLCDKFKHTRFEPSGWTGNSNIGYATSIMDYLFRWLEMKFITGQQQFLFPELKTQTSPLTVPLQMPPVAPNEVETGAQPSSAANRETRNQKPETVIHATEGLRELLDMGDAPSCHVCGAIMVRNGSCFRCMSCGSTSGCS